MADTNETIADIIAEKRRQADKIERDCAEKIKRGEMISDQFARELVADIRREADRLEAAHKRERGDCAKSFKTVGTRFDICQDIELVLKIGRDYQNKDGYRGAHYDTVKLLCDAIEYQQEQLEAKTEIGDAAKQREVCEKMLDLLTAEGFEDGGMSIELDEEQVIMWRNRFRAALSAPPRNCDEYANYKDAMNAFDAFVRKQGKLGFINLYTESFKWLFAPATEKEGGAK
jgi:hypothetical protein